MAKANDMGRSINPGVSSKEGDAAGICHSTNPSVADAVAEFLDAMKAAGIRPTEPIAALLALGGPVRFHAEGDKPGRRNGWAFLHLDDTPAGVFRHYRLGIREVWRAGSKSYCALSPRQRADAEKRRSGADLRKAQTQEKQRDAADLARKIWRTASSADANHPYLVRKNIPPFRIRQMGNTLIVPMIDSSFDVWNVQRITPAGEKLFLAGGKTAKLFWSTGAVHKDRTPTPGPLIIGEGYATMAAVHDATGFGVVAAMSAGNLQAVARDMRRLFPDRLIILAADNDWHLPENIGVSSATQAAKAIGALVAYPKQSTPAEGSASSGTDFADVPRSDVVAQIAEAGRPYYE